MLSQFLYRSDILKKTKFKWTYIVFILIAVACIFLLFSDTNVSGSEITINNAYTLIEEGKVSDVYIKDGVIKIRVVASEIPQNQFPGKADHYLKCTQDTIKR